MTGCRRSRNGSRELRDDPAWRRPCFLFSGWDFVQMPHRSQFVGSKTSTAAEAYYSTTFHELTHWTGPAKRCGREFGKRFGDRAYAFEELVAELGAAFLSADHLVKHEPRADHAGTSELARRAERRQARRVHCGEQGGGCSAVSARCRATHRDRA